MPSRGRCSRSACTSWAGPATRSPNWTGPPRSSPSKAPGSAKCSCAKPASCPLFHMYLGIEIGGTKLQLGIGLGDGVLLASWRGGVDVAASGEGIRRQIVAAVPELVASAGVERGALRGVGVGFGGPVDDDTRSVIKSHQIAGWDGFPLADWIGQSLGLPAILGNDADVAGLAEALFGAGRGLSPVFYMTIGSGIGGGLIVNGEILRGTGRGAAEIGHLKVRDPRTNDGRLDA